MARQVKEKLSKAELAPHSEHSSFRECIIRHLFVGDVLRHLWKLKIYDVEILLSEFDAAGYDLIIGCRRTVRHIQLKASIEGGKTAGVDVGLRLMDAPSGCVVWMVISPGLEIKSYLWLGGPAGERLPDIQDYKITPHTRGEKADRPALRKIGKGQFERVSTLEGLVEKLFAVSASH